MSALVPRLWPDSTVVCIASGPSLTVEDCELVRGKNARVIVINGSYVRAPWADALYACDGKWWKANPAALKFEGLKFGLERECPKGVHVLKNTGVEGLELNPIGVRNGGNSGYQAINLAVHLGASRIVLLGYDCMKGPKGEVHWHPTSKDSGAERNLEKWQRRFPTLVEPLKKLNIQIINCSRRTALRCFERAELRDVLKASAEVAA